MVIQHFCGNEVIKSMLVLITYDVNTETAAGKKRLRKVAKQDCGRLLNNASTMEEGFRILYLNALLIMHNV